MAATAVTKFDDLNTKMVYTPKTAEGKGFLPPLLRAMVHIFYALGIAEDELPKTKGTTAAADKKEAETMKKVKEEITASISHLDKVEISENFSSVSQDQLVTFQKTLKALSSEFDGWDRDRKINNLTSLANKAFGISAMLDRELIGLRNSDAGSNL